LTIIWAVNGLNLRPFTIYEPLLAYLCATIGLNVLKSILNVLKM